MELSLVKLRLGIEKLNDRSGGRLQRWPYKGLLFILLECDRPGGGCGIFIFLHRTTALALAMDVYNVNQYTCLEESEPNSMFSSIKQIVGNTAFDLTSSG